MQKNPKELRLVTDFFVFHEKVNAAEKVQKKTPDLRHHTAIIHFLLSISSINKSKAQ